jgi:hypothetical protein
LPYTTAPRPVSHTLAGQFYWLTGNDPHRRRWLPPADALSLARWRTVYQTVQDDRFGEELRPPEMPRAGANSARARCVRIPAAGSAAAARNRKISASSTASGAVTTLLVSLPPVWRSLDLAVAFQHRVDVPRHSRRPDVKQAVKASLVDSN